MDSSCSLQMTDLPSLSLLSSVSNSFIYPRILTFKSIYIHFYIILLDMMSISSIQLINPFSSNLHVSIDSVNPILSNLIPSSSLQICSDINSLPSEITDLSVPSNQCKDAPLTTLEIRDHSNLTSFNVGDFNFKDIGTFYMSDLPSLVNLTIGSNSFTTSYYNIGLNTARSFYLLHCSSLESITIRAFSFSDYSGDFILEGVFPLFV